MTHASLSRRGRQPRTLVVAAAGYGKTAAMETAGDDTRCLAAAEVLAAGAPPTGGDLFVDDLDRLEHDEQVDVLRILGGLDPSVRLVIASRRPVEPCVRRLLNGPVRERGPVDLALDVEAVARVLRDDYGLDDALLATQVHALTAGWPALVHFAADAAHRGTPGGLLSALAEPGSPAADWVEHEVIAALPGAAVASLEVAAEFDRLTPDLHVLVAADVDRTAAESYAWLRRTGVLVAHPKRRGCEDMARVVPLVAAVLRSSRRPPPSEGADRVVRAAEWYAVHGEPYAAAECLARAGRSTQAVSLVLERGDEMLAAGDAAVVVDILAGCSSELSPTGRQLWGDALRMTGDAAAALRAFAPLVAQASHDGAWPASLAWRVAMVHYMLADYAGALDVLDRVQPGGVAEGRDDIELLACRANVLSMLGAEEEAAAVAATAVRAAARLDDRAAASAHLAAANTSTGAAKETHLAQAKAASSRSGDVVLTARVLLNSSYGLLGAARYSLALDAATEAVRLAELGSPPGILAISLHNQGEALRRLGRFDEAELHLRRSVAVCQEHGLHRAAFGLWGIAEIHRELGRPQQSAIAYEAAIEAARLSGEVQVLVPALSGLARLRAHVTGEVEAARAAADEARSLAPPEFAAYAWIAAGWVALVAGDEEAARRGAAESLAAARSSAAIDALAEALELSAAVEDKPKVVKAALDEALAIWSAGAAQPAADRVLVMLGRLPGADGEARWLAREAAQRLVRQGIHSINGQPSSSELSGSHVEVRLLGGFEVRIGGQPVPLPAWRSKQARTLVKILASRRGRVVTRSELCELLWPDDEPARTGHRLSVLLSAVRGVLDPDRVWPADHFVAADLTGLSLDLEHVTVDAERLLQDSALAADLLREGDVDRAGELLGDVVSLYQGEALEDEPYADWADGIREQARAAALRSLRNLALVRRRTGEHYEAASLLVRLLAEDPYDEAAHRALVDVLSRGGRHGEARRAFDRWTSAMRAIDAPPPDPAALHAGRSSSRDGASARRPGLARPTARSQSPASLVG